MIDVNSALQAHTATMSPEHRESHGELMKSLAQKASDFWQHGENTTWCNRRLIEQGHGLMVISDVVRVAPVDEVPDPQNANEIGSFPAGFNMGVWDGDTKRPVSLEELFAMHSQGMDKYMEGRLVGDHRDRPAFWRALVLAPALLINLVSSYSDWVQQERKRPLKSFGPEIYLAYQVMSRLIDRSDPGVLKPDNRVDKGYLFDRRVRLHRYAREDSLT